MSFERRLSRLPTLGIGVSTEYGAAEQRDSLDIDRLHAEQPQFASFLEIGVEISKGLDAASRRWINAQRPSTYHFLDINLDDPEDFDDEWLAAVRARVEEMDPAWLCGDAGLWHFGRRERGHMLLLPPILSDDSASRMAEGIVRLREETQREVFPENPPGAVFVGDLHLLDFFARVCERADTGMLLDCAHLAIYQRSLGHEPLTGLDDFPTERIVEMHVAGSRECQLDGYVYYEDDHTPAVLDDTWSIFERAVGLASNLRAVVFECERNTLADNLPGFRRIRSILGRSAVVGP